MCTKTTLLSPLPFLFLIIFGAANKIQHYAVDLGHNITLPCTAPHKGGVQWSRSGRNVHARPLDDGSLQILDVNREDAGMYACTPANDAREDVKQEINLTVRTPPPPLVNVTIVPSTILALILWDVQGTGGYPIIDFTAQYRLADNTNDTWLPISPNHIPPNCRQIDVYKLEANTSYAFRVWATNQLGGGEITEVVATTKPKYTEQELAKHFLADAKRFDTRVWVVAVAIVMGTLVTLGLGTCFLLYQECRIPGVVEEQEIIELVPNIILNPGFDGNNSSHTIQHFPADENSNSETTLHLNNNTVVQPNNV